MNRRVKQALMKHRENRMEYMEPYNERSGTFRVSPDGTRVPVYPGMEYSGIEWPYMKFRDRTGREHYDNGRFAPENRADWQGIPDNYPYVPPVYERTRNNTRPMNRIGFATPQEENMARYQSNEMAYKQGDYTSGYGKARNGIEPISDQEAIEWVNRMKNADGSIGPHFTMEQVRQLMEQQKIQCDEMEFYVVINMMYSDYCKVAKKHNCSTMEFYGGLAKAFLDDKDAQPEKLTRYYDYIAKH